MAKTITLSASAAVSGDGQTGTVVLPPSFPAVNAGGSTGGEVAAVLATGANTIAVPAGHQGVWVIPPSGNVVTMTLKGVTGDTGVPLHATLGAILFFPLGTTSFVITAGAAGVTVQLLWL
jgi:hypothetical protein